MPDAPGERTHGFWFWLALTAVIGLGILLRSQHMTDVPSRSPDERTYTSYAATLADDGVAGYRPLFGAYNADPGQWLYPGPSRFGFVLLEAGVMSVTGIRNPRAGAAISWLFSIFSLLLLAWMGWRFLPRWATVFGVAFLACSVGELGMARRSWQDSLFGFLGLLLVYLTCEITHAPRRRGLYLALAAVGTYSLLIKESAYLSYGICGLWLAGVLLVRERSWRWFGMLAAAGAASALAALATWGWLAGGVSPAVASMGHLIEAARTNPYLAENASGPWYQFFYLQWITGPVTALMALTGGVVAAMGDLGVPRTPLRMALLMAAAFFGLGAFGPNLQYLRIVSPANGAYCLLAGVGVWSLFTMAAGGRRRNFVLAAVVLLGLAGETVHNYYVFREVVVASGIQELDVREIRQIMKR